MAYSHGNLSKAEAWELEQSVKAKTPAKGGSMPFDPERIMKEDLRDPRMDASQWPCYRQHLPDTWKANGHGRWLHCKVCNLRLRYEPRVGSPSNTTSVENPSMVMRMLQETYNLTGGRIPTQSICRAVQNKIDAEETMKKSAAMVLAQPLQVPAPKFQDKEKLQEFENKQKRSTSPAPSWDLVTKVMTDMEELMTPQEKRELMELLRSRRQGQATSSQNLARAYEEEVEKM